MVLTFKNHHTFPEVFMRVPAPASMLRLTCLLMLLAGAHSHACGENWPGWRGPRGDGTSAEPQVPERWSGTENVAWKIEAPAESHASPIIWDDRVYLVGTDLARNTRLLRAHDRKTGKQLWEQTVAESPLERKHKLNSYASSTPATDGEKIYVSFLDQKQMLIAAYDFNGKELWKVQPGPFSSVHGYCSSPVLYQDKVIINGDHDGDSYLVALDRTTGKTVWKTSRENHTRSYCTPIIREINGRVQMMLSGNKCVASYDPETGVRQWVIDGPTEQFVASLVYSHDLLFVTGGFPDKHILAINPAGTGNVTDSHVVWRHERRGVSYVPSPVVVGDYFVVASDDGIATCFEATSGRLLWQERMGRHYSASLITANGLIYFLDDDGVMKAIKPGPKVDVVSENQLGESCYASPAISQGQLYIRGSSHLYCIGRDAVAVKGR